MKRYQVWSAVASSSSSSLVFLASTDVLSYHMLLAARSKDWKEMFQNTISPSLERRRQLVTKTTSASGNLWDPTWPAKPETNVYSSDFNKKAAFILRGETKLITSFLEAELKSLLKWRAMFVIKSRHVWKERVSHHISFQSYQFSLSSYL